MPIAAAFREMLELRGDRYYWRVDAKDAFRRCAEESPGTRHAILDGYDDRRPVLQGAWPPAKLTACARCGQPTVRELCKACEMKERLESLAQA